MGVVYVNQVEARSGKIYDLKVIEFEMFTKYILIDIEQGYAVLIKLNLIEVQTFLSTH